MIDPEIFGAAMGDLVREAVEPLKKRIGDLEAQLGDAQKSGHRGLAFKGAFQRALAYDEGSVVTHGDRVYVAVKEIPAGEHLRDGVDGWVLMVKGSAQP